MQLSSFGKIYNNFVLKINIMLCDQQSHVVQPTYVKKKYLKKKS